MKTNTNRRFLLWSVLGLIMLLVFSPCQVRNAMQSAFGLEQTSVLNKSQTTVQTSSCAIIDRLQSSNTLSKTKTKVTLSSGLTTSLFTLAKFFPKKQALTSLTKWHTTLPVVPLYILFKNLKVYL
ncbi:hypothetical protein ACFFU9_05315 [Mariniflexile ostreae]|uniref:Uncharacterized protein n=1 Tax=Mariniflexile ostreae TaxID=1520892 RepID=A0ABV5F9N3_9FLAO